MILGKRHKLTGAKATSGPWNRSGSWSGSENWFLFRSRSKSGSESK